MEGKVHLHCVYIYNDSGKEITDRYKSPKHSHNIVNPIIIMNTLKDEIKKETGRTVKDFLFFGKEPVGI